MSQKHQRSRDQSVSPEIVDEGSVATGETVKPVAQTSGLQVSVGSWSSTEPVFDGKEETFLFPHRRQSRKPVVASPILVQPPADVECLFTAGLLTAGPGRIKIDLLTPLEQAFVASGFLGGTLLLFAAIKSGGVPAPDLLTFLGILFLVVGGLGFKYTDNYYVVDVLRRVVSYHFQFLHLEQETIMADTRSMACVTSHAELRRDRGEYWFEYATALIMKDGTLFPVSDYQRDGLLMANHRARLVAGYLGLPFVSGCENADVIVTRHDSSGDVQVAHRLIDVTALNSPVSADVAAGTKQIQEHWMRSLMAVPAIMAGVLFIMTYGPYFFLLVLLFVLRTLLLH
ncbi:MAG TPA: hypothetical protein PKO06_10440 [Candidatus Ozemobacteraceae bacterium]|nr:hypothetical protein [Candidatus Ozemobacteraceae bacterium]